MNQTRGEKETIIIRQPLSVEMADRMWAEKSSRVPLKFAGVSISFNTIGVMAPKHFSWFGVPELTVDEAKRL